MAVPQTAANRLNQIGFQYAVGFALNTSNYQTTADSRAYGEQVSALLGGKGFVVDTSRNGNGSNGEWCNPRGRALGDRPALVDDATHLDALLWVKSPGESDGTCNGGPAAGAWWQDVALELARNAHW
ncbi:glycoside hydrolase family 6 protein [Cellulomonas soli]